MFSEKDDGLDEIRKLFGDLSKGLDGNSDSLRQRSKDKATKTTVTPLKLKETFKLFAIKNEFRPGMLVKWKEGLANKGRPAVGEPAIVVEVLTSPVYEDTQECGSPYFREPLDVVIGMVTSQGEFITYYYDSRRFELYE